jgi:hypothetical protein
LESSTPPSVEAAIEREQQLFETFARIADYLCIDTEAARRAEGKPSDVFIAAIEAAIEATKEKIEAMAIEWGNARLDNHGGHALRNFAAAIRGMK